MKILVLDTAAENGGALTVLNRFYNTSIEDSDNSYVFATGKVSLENKDNVTCRQFKWSKINWGCRIIFDYLYLPFYVKKNKFDYVLSLQNTAIPFIKTRQCIYMHNILPFSEYKFRIVENLKLWTYQNIIGVIIRKSLKKAHHIIVQTDWIKEELTHQLNLDSNKISVDKFKVELIEVENKKQFPRITFFYPASGEVFKNHQVIVDATKDLIEQGINNFTVLFTLNGNENKYVSKMKQDVKTNRLPIEFIGLQSKENMYEYYNSSVLLFPSYIETVGLPLLEASLVGSKIVVSDLNFARAALQDVNDVSYFNPFNSKELSRIMGEMISNNS